jgi:hypothetical protein
MQQFSYLGCPLVATKQAKKNPKITKEWTKKLNCFNFSSFFGDFCLKVCFSPTIKQSNRKSKQNSKGRVIGLWSVLLENY